MYDKYSKMRTVIEDRIVNWEPISEPLLSGDRITCRIGDTVISGKVTVSPKVITVALDFPRETGIIGKSVDLLTPVIFTETIEDGSPASWYGLCIAKELLLARYYGEIKEKD